MRGDDIGPRLPDDLGWGDLLPDLQIVDVPGNHYWMIRPPRATTLAERLREVLSAHGAPEAASL
jgi:thioesterase domain-containing protein